MMNKINSVCVYCASSTKIDSVYFDAARELGTLLGQRQIRLINGAGNMGLMSAVSDAALRAGGEVTGVIPRFMVEQGWHHTGLTQLVEVESMHERKKTMADLSDAVIALPDVCVILHFSTPPCALTLSFTCRLDSCFSVTIRDKLGGNWVLGLFCQLASALPKVMGVAGFGDELTAGIAEITGLTG
jgi:hypothetical protein